MEDIIELQCFFPWKISDPILENYIYHHLDHLQKCIEIEAYASAYTHLHLLYMVFVYIQLLRIAKEKKQEFDFCWIGFPTQEKDFLKNPSSPFSFSNMNEKTVFRFFRLLGFDDGVIWNISELVNKRNEHLHANGEILFENSEDFWYEISNYLEKMKTIVEKQKAFLQVIYNEIVSGFSEDYEVKQDDIESSFLLPYFFSEYELVMLSLWKKDKLSWLIQWEYCQ